MSDKKEVTLILAYEMGEHFGVGDLKVSAEPKDWEPILHQRILNSHDMKVIGVLLVGENEVTQSDTLKEACTPEKLVREIEELVEDLPLSVYPWPDMRSFREKVRDLIIKRDEQLGISVKETDK